MNHMNNTTRPTALQTIQNKIKSWKFKIKTFIPRMKAKYKLYQKNKKILKELRTPFAQPDKQVLWENFIKSRKAETAFAINPSKNKKCTGLDTPIDITIARIVRQVIDKIDVIKQIVGVQPMSGPVGLVYAMQCSESSERMPSVLPGEARKHLKLEIVKAAVEAYTRKLQAAWTLEAAQDMLAVHGLDIEEEIISIMVQEMLTEIVAANVAAIGSINEVTKSTVATPQEISAQVHIASSEIAAKTRRGAGNFAIVDHVLLAMLESDPSFIKSVHDKNSPLPMVGILNGSIKIFTSFFGFPEGVNCIVGYKGNNGETDCGAIYCPYILATAAAVTIDPRSFCPMVKFYTRNGMFYNDGTLTQAKHYYKSLSINLDLDKYLEPIETTKKPRVSKKEMAAGPKPKAKKVSRKIQQPAKTGTLSKEVIKQAVKTVSEQRKQND